MMIKGREIANRAKGSLNALKKNNVKTPMSPMRIPPIRFHLQAMMTNTKSTNQGIALGEFIKIPCMPPPYSSAPDNKAKTNQNNEITSKIVSTMFFVILADLALSNLPLQ